MALWRAILLLHYKGAVQEGEEETEEGSRRRKRGKKWIRWAWRGIGISLINSQLQRRKGEGCMAMVCAIGIMRRTGEQ